MTSDRLPLDERIGRRVAAARTAHGMSQADLAHRLGIEADTLADMEAGRTRVNATVFYGLSGTLHRTLSFFFSEDD